MRSDLRTPVLLLAYYCMHDDTHMRPTFENIEQDLRRYLLPFMDEYKSSEDPTVLALWKCSDSTLKYEIRLRPYSTLLGVSLRSPRS